MLWACLFCSIIVSLAIGWPVVVSLRGGVPARDMPLLVAVAVVFGLSLFVVFAVAWRLVRP